MWRLSTICRCSATRPTSAGCTGTAPTPRYDPALGRNRQTLRPREEWVEIPIPAIIDDDTFDAVQHKARDNSAYSPRRTEPETFLLRRLLRCAHCGVKLVCHRARRAPRHHPLLPLPPPRPLAGRRRRAPLPRTTSPSRRTRQLRLRPDPPAARPPRPPHRRRNSPHRPDPNARRRTAHRSTGPPGTAPTQPRRPSGTGWPTSTKPESSTTPR